MGQWKIIMDSITKTEKKGAEISRCTVFFSMPYFFICHRLTIFMHTSNTKELERNNLRNAFFNSNEIREQSMESFKYSVKIESSYFAAGTYTGSPCRGSLNRSSPNRG